MKLSSAAMDHAEHVELHQIKLIFFFQDLPVFLSSSEYLVLSC
jgi:hypothetical protein